MASNSISTSSQRSQTAGVAHTADAKGRASAGSFITLAGRILFAAIFIIAGFFHFSQQEISYAAHAGVPVAALLVPASGILAMLGGLSIVLGYRVKIGAWLLVLFLVPVTLIIHNFWAAKDPMMAQMQMAMFIKNASMLGGALLISQFGAGPLSLDARRKSAC
ncbi:MAG: DoxX family protein [Terriglobales bacterium]